MSQSDNSVSMSEIAKIKNTEVKKALALNQKNATISGAGFEPLVVGYSFGLDLNNISDFIVGENGVYKLKVIKKDDISNDEQSINSNFINSFLHDTSSICPLFSLTFLSSCAISAKVGDLSTRESFCLLFKF